MIHLSQSYFGTPWFWNIEYKNQTHLPLSICDFWQKYWEIGYPKIYHTEHYLPSLDFTSYVGTKILSKTILFLHLPRFKLLDISLRTSICSLLTKFQAKKGVHSCGWTTFICYDSLNSDLKFGVSFVFLGPKWTGWGVFGSTHVVEQLSFPVFPSILTFNFYLILG